MRNIEVVQADKKHARYDLEVGEVFMVNCKLYVVAKHNGHTFGVCLNESSTLEYDDIPLYVELYQVTQVAKL